MGLCVTVNGNCIFKMRKLKYRVWDHKKKQFVFNGSELGDILEEIYDLEFLEYVLRNRFIWQQHIELNDKDGKNIYEGDVVEFSYTPDNKFIGEIKWLDDRAAYGIICGNAFETMEEMMDYMTNVKIVGNVFETPELIK